MLPYMDQQLLKIITSLPATAWYLLGVSDVVLSGNMHYSHAKDLE